MVPRAAELQAEVLSGGITAHKSPSGLAGEGQEAEAEVLEVATGTALHTKHKVGHCHTMLLLIHVTEQIWIILGFISN